MLPETVRAKLGGKTLVVSGLVASVLLNVAFLAYTSRGDEGEPDPRLVELGVEQDVSNPSVPPELVAPLPEPKGAAGTAGTYVHHADIRSSLSAAFVGAPGTSAPALSQVYARLFVWDIDLRRSLQKGDVMDALYTQAPDPCPERTRKVQAGESVGGMPPECYPPEPVILAARLSNRPGEAGGRVLRAYRWQAPGDRFASYWDDMGYEVSRRLIDGPVKDYEQVTSLLKDRPTHAGMDFKAPVGVDVTTPRAGVVTRMNWNHAANGNCVEVKFQDGVVAKFLHLNENLVKVGQNLTAGTVVGKLGNTGHSFGPHLHYQLEKNGGVLDPVDYHGVLRRQLPVGAMEMFDKVKKDSDTQLDGRVAEL